MSWRFGISASLLALGLGLQSWAASSPICVVALLRNNGEFGNEFHKLGRALSQELSSSELSRLDIQPGVQGFAHCLSPDSNYESVVIIAHAAQSRDSEEESHLLIPVNGVDLKFRPSDFIRWIQGSSAQNIVIASCKAQRLNVRKGPLSTDPRIHWIESNRDPVQQELSIEEAIQAIRDSGLLF